WNLAMRRIPGWPQTRLQLPARKEVYLIPDAAFPDSFRRDLDALMAELVNPDPLSNAFFSRPVREVTAGIYRGQLRRFASELVHSGVEMAELQSVCILLEPQNAERGLRQMLKRTANKSTPLIRDIAALLRNLAKRTNRPVAVQDRLSELAKRVALPSQRGITRKNRDRLRVLQSEENTLRLLTLPERLFAAAPPGKPHSFSEVCALEDAVAIGILLVCPVRIGNLATIHLDRHFQRPGDGRVYLVFVEDETKNERPLEFELPAQLVSMIDRYLATRSPYRCPKGTPWLFSRRDGAGPVHSGQLAHRLSKRILKATGFEMNAHLFRHFAVMNWLNANPGGYEVARRLLGHAETSHTINMYSGLEITSATKAFADLIEAKRTAGRKTRGTRP
ncbi:MAG: site-specific integrase, partial [Gemmobacter sp.]|nr:site-specific integrase [Gemmobacter sp.]